MSCQSSQKCALIWKIETFCFPIKEVKWWICNRLTTAERRNWFLFESVQNPFGHILQLVCICGKYDRMTSEATDSLVLLFCTLCSTDITSNLLQNVTKLILVKPKSFNHTGYYYYYQTTPQIINNYYNNFIIIIYYKTIIASQKEFKAVKMKIKQKWRPRWKNVYITDIKVKTFSHLENQISGLFPIKQKHENIWNHLNSLL